MILCRGSLFRDESISFPQKDPKPFLPVRVPSEPTQKQVLRGAWSTTPNQDVAQKLARLRQSSPKSKIRDGRPAVPNAGEMKGDDILSLVRFFVLYIYY